MSKEEQPDPAFVAQQLRKPSGDFAVEIGQKMNQANKPLYELLLDIIAVEDENRILEIGFGNGAFFEDLFGKAQGLKVSGIDFSKEMVKAARDECGKFVENGQLNLKLGNSNDLPFPDDTFDLVFCNMVVYFWDEPAAHLSEVYRVLKPGGRFYTGLRTRDSMLIFPFVEYGFNLYTIDDWEDIVRENGFELVETHRRSDPEIELDGRQLRLESCCVEVRKK